MIIKMEQIQELTHEEKIKLSTTEISKRIRIELKEKFRGCKFSVTTQYYSMGSSISVHLMEANIKVIQDFNNIPQEAILRQIERGYSEKDIKICQEEKHRQLNQYSLREEYNPENWDNGIFLTEKGHNLLREVVKIADAYNYDHSDSQTDYYDVNFSFDIEIGKWDKDFLEATK